VELSPGSKITLTVRPHILIPDTSGTAAFEVPEPGFNTSLGYRQNATVAAVLSHSISQLDGDSMKLGNAIDQLQQILVSLPKPEPTPQPEPKATPQPEPKATPQPEPKATPKTEPKPKTIPKTTKAAPKATPKATPKAAPKPAPKLAPTLAPNR
jgi:outer membrane biosynthesis protein TonB